jgi:glutamate-1-semialdehyde aminotransferase
MDNLMALNLVGYAAVLGGGLVLGTLFGRSIVSDLSGIVHSLESRVVALETTEHLTGAATKTSVEPAAAAIKSHAEATQKLASAIETHAAAKTASN